MTVGHVGHSPTQLEDEVEYSTVTALRGKLLAVVDGFRRAPAKRYLITKHGQPQAVLMSFETYRLLRGAKAQPLPAQSDDALELGEAIARSRSARELAQPPETVTNENDIGETIDVIRRRLDCLETEMNKRLSAAELDPNQTSR
jgi:prevent-host-death family protein